MEKQLFLFPTTKPLQERFGKMFFKSAPEAPGVYLMAAANERVLYVGQSKNLRKRLAFYKNTDLAKARGKLRRLIAAVHSITWEVCASEQQAKLRENEMLRLHQPRHNVMNARPKSYAFVGMTVCEQSVRLRLSLAPERQDSERLYGVFKNRAGTIRAFSALSRLLWSSQFEPANIHAVPSRLLRNKAVREETFGIESRQPLAASLAVVLLNDFFLGASDALIGILRCEISYLTELDLFTRNLLVDDLSALAEFYEAGPRRNAALRARHGIIDPLIGQEEIDDLITLAASKSIQKPVAADVRRIQSLQKRAA